MANANLYIQAWREQKGLATFFSSQRGKLGKILTGLVDKAYGGFTVVHEGDLTSGRSFFYNVYLSCLDTTAGMDGCCSVGGAQGQTRLPVILRLVAGSGWCFRCLWPARFH